MTFLLYFPNFYYKTYSLVFFNFFLFQFNKLSLISLSTIIISKDTKFNERSKGPKTPLAP